MINKRSIIGLFLMILAIIGLVGWELYGRDAVMKSPVLVATRNIQPGMVINPKDFAIVGVSEENKVQGAMCSKDYGVLAGKLAERQIYKNQQILPDFFIEKELCLDKEESIFVIKPEWISMRSSSIRRGDLVKIYEDRGKSLLGAFRVAFVKDRNDSEIEDREVRIKNPLDRTDATAVVSHIEIIAGFPDYLRILDEVADSRLIIVQKWGEEF
jgi:hypothetical protein